MARLRATSLAGKDSPSHRPLGSTYSFGIMETKCALAFVRPTGVAPTVCMLLMVTAALAADVRTNAIDPRTIYGEVPVTCKLAYYAEFQYNGKTNGYTYDMRLEVADTDRTNSVGLEVSGVIMEVISPPEFAGKSICVWLDFELRKPQDVYFKLGVVYRASVSPHY
jgi:hypothetical protein